MPISRRQFLASSAGAFLAAHNAVVAGARQERGMEPVRICALELLTAAPLAAMKDFYGRTLGLRILSDTGERLTIATGTTRLSFVPSAVGERPFYHFAFNIPENKIVPALEWQQARSPLLYIPPPSRAAGYPDAVADYRHWNAHSVFFLDPGGNVVEYIARHDLRNAAPGTFGPQDILHASEIAFVVDNVRQVGEALKPVAAVGQYRGADDNFLALGDESGLLLIMKRGRILNFNPASTEKAAAVFQTRVWITGPAPAEYRWDDFPYSLTIQRSDELPSELL
jgi:catechol 2,3-dioxygenase-like lactoylglutathione lyase family enzyme